MVDGTWIQIFADFLLTNWVWVLVGLAVIAVLVGKLVKNIKETNKVKKEAKMKEEIKKTISEEPKREIIREGVNDDFSHVFSDKPMRNINEETVFQNISSVVDLLNKESETLNKALHNDFESLKNELNEVHRKREIIRNYGKKLGDLFQRYTIRENQLTIQLANLEDFIKRKQ